MCFLQGFRQGAGLRGVFLLKQFPKYRIVKWFFLMCIAKHLKKLEKFYCRIKFPKFQMQWKFQTFIETLTILYFLVCFQCQLYKANLKEHHLRLLLLFWVKTTCEQYFGTSALTWKALLLKRLNYSVYIDMPLCIEVQDFFHYTYIHVWSSKSITAKNHLFMLIFPSTLPPQLSYICKNLLHSFLVDVEVSALYSDIKINVVVSIQRGTSDILLLFSRDTGADRSLFFSHSSFLHPEPFQL